MPHKQRAIGWSIELDAETGQQLVLGANTAREQIKQAADLCVNGLCRAYDLSAGARRGIDSRFDGMQAWIVEGAEGEVPTRLHLGTVISNVVQLDGTPVEMPTSATPDVRVSLEGISEEAANLHRAMKLFLESRPAALSDGTKEAMNGYLEESDLLLGAAVRIAAARRILKYVVLPKGTMDGDALAKVGFKTWVDEQITRRNPNETISRSRLKSIRDNYAETGMALKNLRRTVWAPIFFSNLGIDQSEVVFYLKYRDVLARNCGNTVTFSNPLAVLLSKEETSAALEGIFAPKKPRLKVVK